MQPNSVFLSYRRADTSGYAGRLYDRLAAGLGKGRVFMDVDSISYGEDFVEVIERTLQSCQVVLVMIGPGWLNARDDRGQQRLEQAADPVRVEVVAALAAKVRVIPILVGGAVMPHEDALPEGLKALYRRNAITLSDKRFNLDAQELIETLKRILPKPVPVWQRLPLRTLGWGLGGVVLAGGAAVLGPGWVQPQRVPGPEVSASAAASAPQLVASSPQPGDVAHECVKGVCFDMVAIPAGTFQMGSPSTEDGREDDEGPVHRVTVPAFWMGQTEVTQGLWQAVMGNNNPSHFKACGSACPVETVSWDDAQAFIQALNRLTGRKYRLPSEAEWEYAARASTKTRYFWGDVVGQGNANCDGCGSRWDNKSTAPAKSFNPNAWGLYDMHGNVWEWAQDAYAETYDASTNGELRNGNAVMTRMLRGGSWFNNPQVLRSASRIGITPGDRSYGTGFRLAKTN